MSALAGHLETLLASFIAHPEHRISQIQMVMVNHATIAAPHDICTHQLFEQQVLRTPDAIALDGPCRLTYDQLNRRANQLARHLRDLGCGPEDFVAICLDPSPEAVIAVLATLKAGAAFLPMHPGLPPARLAAMLDD